MSKKKRVKSVTKVRKDEGMHGERERKRKRIKRRGEDEGKMKE